MAIEQETIGDLVVLRPTERLDVSTAPALRVALEGLFGRAGREVVIDLAGVSYVSSVGLSTLLRGAQLAQAQGGRVVLAGLQDVVQEAFEMAGLDRVLAVYPTLETAAASFGWAKPQRASGARELETGLSLPEEVFLLALRDEGGALVDLPENALDFALAGAVLLDLCARGRVDSDLERVHAADASPLADAILDPALAAIARAREPRPAEGWVGALASEGAEIRRRVVDRLVERGILRRKDSLVQWVLGRRRTPLVEAREQREIKARVLAVLTRDEVPGPREVAVIALADACAVFDALLDMDEMLAIRPRIAAVARMDLVAQAMRRALRAAHASGSWTAAPEGIYGRTADVRG